MIKRNYSTQMDAAVKGILTPEMISAAAREGLNSSLLMKKIASGVNIIPANRNHKNLEPRAIGEGLSIKVNVNLGISKDCPDYDLEKSKAELAIELNADAIMDLSCWGKTRDFRRDLINLSPLPIGTVPLYDAVGAKNKGLMDLTGDDFLDVVRMHAEDGVDFVTIHAGLTKHTVSRLMERTRIMPLVSRGGSLLLGWMHHTGKENPFYERFDELLEICREYDVTLSLGDGCRPGCLHDATDRAQIEELLTLGELTEKAWKRDVQVMIEGPGHMALNEIEANMLIQKKLCKGAPFYVLGPLVTDIAPGYDHITGAIGGAFAAYKGADFLCYVTPSEHLRLPDLEDVREGIIAFRIAAHAGSLARGDQASWNLDNKMAEARAALDWETMFQLAMDEKKARQYRTESLPAEENSCTMCGDFCAVKRVNEILSV